MCYLNQFESILYYFNFVEFSIFHELSRQRLTRLIHSDLNSHKNEAR
jgi:hypothetical protein